MQFRVLARRNPAQPCRAKQSTASTAMPVVSTCDLPGRGCHASRSCAWSMTTALCCVGRAVEMVDTPLSFAARAFSTLPNAAAPRSRRFPFQRNFDFPGAGSSVAASLATAAKEAGHGRRRQRRGLLRNLRGLPEEEGSLASSADAKCPQEKPRL